MTGDVLLYQSHDGGEILLEDGDVVMDNGLQTSVYLATFGGNHYDAGEADSRKQWWGNGTETDDDFKYRAETQHIVRSLPPTSLNLLRVEQAAIRDTEYLKRSGVATGVTVSASIPALNRLDLEFNITLTDGAVEVFNITETWSA